MQLNAGASRRRYLALLLATILLGLGSRRFGAVLPRVVATYAGDTLWATAAYWGVSLLAPARSRLQRGVTALAISFLVELSQLYHRPWLDAIRATRLGGWILGFGFLWSDLACYAIGVALAVALDHLLDSRRLLPRS